MQTEQYEVNWKNYYNILELSPTANAQEIKRAYRRLARKYHPDQAEDSLASDRMAEINEAYEVLSDTDRRARYNKRFKPTCGRQPTVEEALEAELTKAVITNLARERRRGRWIERLQVPIPNISFFVWLVYLLICGILLWSGLCLSTSMSTP